jgi:hypothetical protein
LKRRSIIKKEINDAILTRNEQPPTDGLQDEFGFAEELTKALQALPSQNESTDYDAKLEASQSAEDEEVAAITEDELNIAVRKNSRDQPEILEQGFELQYKSDRDEHVEKPVPRRLDYNNAAVGNSHPASSSGSTKRSTHSRSTLDSEGGIRTGAADSIHSSANNSKHSSEQNGRTVNPLEKGWTNPVGRVPERLASEGFGGNDNLNNQSLDAELKEEMKRFASDTRAALRWKVEPDTGKTTQMS